MNVLPRIQSFTCPCCRGFIGEAAPVEYLQDAVVGGLQTKIIIELINRQTRPIRMDALIDRCFEDDPNGGPDDPANSITVAIHKLRKRISPLGWHIERTGGGGRGSDGGAFYRLIPMEVGQ